MNYKSNKITNFTVVGCLLLMGCDNRPDNTITMEVEVSPKGGKQRIIKKDCKLLQACRVQYLAPSPYNNNQETSYTVMVSSAPDVNHSAIKSYNKIDENIKFERYDQEAKVISNHLDESVLFRRQDKFTWNKKTVYQGKMERRLPGKSNYEDAGSIKITVW